MEGERGQSANTKSPGRRGQGGPRRPYQFGSSQPSSAGTAGGPAFLAPSAPSPPSLWLFLLGEAEPHTSQLSELLLSAEVSAQVQLSLLGDFRALADSVLPKVSQKLWSMALFWKWSGPLFW